MTPIKSGLTQSKYYFKLNLLPVSFEVSSQFLDYPHLLGLKGIMLENEVKTPDIRGMSELDLSMEFNPNNIFPPLFLLIKRSFSSGLRQIVSLVNSKNAGASRGRDN